tara:strand:- start:6332 stop:6919 length:588 start_codon:yes stop_codon:yes gene_type:complete
MKKFVRSRVIREREINMISTNKAIAGVVLVTLLNGFISVNLFKQQNLFYTNEVDKLLVDNQKLHTELEQFYKYGVEVNVTMYQPVYPQTDNTPDITADGTRIRINKASDYKFVALSRNLLKRWGGPFDYGDFILIKGTKTKDGVYQVRDTMNPKYVNYVDILESINVKPYKYENVQIYKMNWTDNLALIKNDKQS